MDGFVCGTGFATGVATRASHAVNVRPQFALMGTMGRTTIGPGEVRGPRMQAAVQVSIPVPPGKFRHTCAKLPPHRMSMGRSTGKTTARA